MKKSLKKLLSVFLSMVILSSICCAGFEAYAAKSPSCTSVKSSSITTNSARVDFTIKNPSYLTIKTCGMQIRKKGTNSWTTKTETVNSKYQKKNSIPVWYTIGSGKEFAFKLSANTTYEYRGLCKYSNKTYYSGVYTFKTSSASTSSTSSISSSKLSALKKKYPEGKTCKNCYTYAAEWAFKYLNGRTPSVAKKNLKGTTAWNNIKAGDVIHYYKSKSDADYKYGSQHWAFVTAKNSSKITIAEGNYKGKVHYGRTIAKSKFTNGNYYNIEIRR